MCFGELGEVVTRFADHASIRTDRGLVEASVLLTPEAEVGDHVVLHSGHVLEVVSSERASTAAELRRAMGAPDDAALSIQPRIREHSDDAIGGGRS